MSCQIVTIQLNRMLQLKQPANKEQNIKLENKITSKHKSFLFFFHLLMFANIINSK